MYYAQPVWMIPMWCSHSRACRTQSKVILTVCSGSRFFGAACLKLPRSVDNGGNNKAKVLAMGTELFEVVDQEWKIIISINWGNSFECSKLVELSGMIENGAICRQNFHSEVACGFGSATSMFRVRKCKRKFSVEHTQDLRPIPWMRTVRDQAI